MKDKLETRGSFSPNEIIFAVTDKCNLRCQHCFVERKNFNLDVAKSKRLIESSLTFCPETEWKIGFTGGEPFLNLDFLCEISKFCVEKGVIFDRIMTNALWWKDEADLRGRLQKVFESGYDGKIGISFDSFHGGDFRYVAKFIKTVCEIWHDNTMCEIQSTFPSDKNSLHSLKKQKQIIKLLFLELDTLGCDAFVRVNFNRQVFSSDSPLAWKDKKWFKEDFCKPLSDILYVHTDGKIAPCCGYANENSALIIGTIDDDYETLVKNAESNQMTQICFVQGLENWRKTELKKQKKSATENATIKFREKTLSACTLCDFVCKNQRTNEKA